MRPRWYWTAGRRPAIIHAAVVWSLPTAPCLSSKATHRAMASELEIRVRDLGAPACVMCGDEDARSHRGGALVLAGAHGSRLEIAVGAICRRHLN